MKKGKVNIDRPQMKPEEVKELRDFDALLKEYNRRYTSENLETPNNTGFKGKGGSIFTKPWIYASAILTAVAISILFYYEKKNTGSENSSNTPISESIADKAFQREEQGSVIKERLENMPEESKNGSEDVLKQTIKITPEQIKKSEPKKENDQALLDYKQASALNKETSLTKDSTLKQQVEGVNRVQSLSEEERNRKVAKLGEEIEELKKSAQLKKARRLIKPKLADKKKHQIHLEILEEEFPDIINPQKVLFEIEEEIEEPEKVALSKDWKKAKILQGTKFDNFKVKLIKGKSEQEFLVVPVYNSVDYSEAMSQYNLYTEELNNLSKVLQTKEQELKNLQP